MLAAPASRAAPAAGWADFPIIVWQTPLPAQLPVLARLGVTATAIIPDRRDGAPPPDPRPLDQLARHGIGFYVENTATDFYAAYHRWQPGLPVNAAFLALQQRHRADPGDLGVFERHPSLSDPAALARIAARLERTVHEYRAYHPLFYSLGDETGIADLAAAWDFDLSPASFSGFRAWLHQLYPDLAALNAEWGTDYRRWDAVRPMLTTAAMQQADGNCAAWSDFKAWMDVAFARAIAAGTAAVHAADPGALPGIEGAQIPGWGGYDYSRLAPAVDVMEIYDAGADLDLAESFNPRLIPLTTSSPDPAAIPNIWREMLRGSRGLILWDPEHRLAGAEGRAMAPVFAALHRIAPQLARATPVVDPVAILYSPASFRVRWLLEHRAAGDAWTQRGAAAEWDDTGLYDGPARFVAGLAGLGLRARFLTDATVSGDGLRGLHALILPQTIALSPAAAQAIRVFVARGGLVIADGEPGLYDEHGRKLARGELADLLAAGGIVRLAASDATAARLAPLLRRAGLPPGVLLRAADGQIAEGVDAYRWRDGSRTILALQVTGSTRVTVELKLDRPTSLSDLATGRALGRLDRFTLPLDPAMPTIFAVADGP